MGKGRFSYLRPVVARLLAEVEEVDFALVNVTFQAVYLKSPSSKVAVCGDQRAKYFTFLSVYQLCLRKESSCDLVVGGMVSRIS